MLTIVRFSDVNGSPMIKLDLPGLLRIGDPVGLKGLIARKTGGRDEVLNISGKFRITTVGVDASTTPQRQLLNVESIDKAPTWQSVRKRSQTPRRLGPAVHPRTPIEDKP